MYDFRITGQHQQKKHSQRIYVRPITIDMFMCFRCPESIVNATILYRRVATIGGADIRETDKTHILQFITFISDNYIVRGNIVMTTAMSESR